MLAQIRKALVALVALAGAVVATGLLHGQALTYVVALIAVAGTFGVHATPNAISGVEKRIADLEASIPGLPDLTQSIGDVVTAGIERAFHYSTATLEPLVAEVAAAPPVQVHIDGKQLGQAVEAHLLRNERGQFAKRNSSNGLPVAPAEPGPQAGVDYPTSA